VRAKCRYCIIN
jgi:hypothetical protein